jgi:hypothetical protein
VGHIKVIRIIHWNMLFPAPEGLTNVQTGLSDHDSVQIIVFSLQSLAQAITAEGAKHATVNMGLNQTGGFVPSQNPDRKNVRSVEYLHWYIGAKVPDDLPPGPFLPFSGIIVSFIDPILKSLIQFATSLQDLDAYT